jgi:hypothetical protein
LQVMNRADPVMQYDEDGTPRLVSPHDSAEALDLYEAILARRQPPMSAADRPVVQLAQPARSPVRRLEIPAPPADYDPAVYVQYAAGGGGWRSARDTWVRQCPHCRVAQRPVHGNFVVPTMRRDIGLSDHVDSFTDYEVRVCQLCGNCGSTLPGPPLIAQQRREENGWGDLGFRLVVPLSTPTHLGMALSGASAREPAVVECVWLDMERAVLNRLTYTATCEVSGCEGTGRAYFDAQESVWLPTNPDGPISSGVLRRGRWWLCYAHDYELARAVDDRTGMPLLDNQWIREA